MATTITNVPVYLQDTPNTILMRIAKLQETTPKYIIIKEKVNDNTFEIINVAELAKTSQKWSDFYNVVSQNLDDFELKYSDEDNLALMFVRFSMFEVQSKGKELENEMLNLVADGKYLEAKEYLNMNNFPSSLPDEFLQENQKFFEEYASQVKDNARKIKFNDEAHERMQKIKPLKYTDFMLVSSVHKISLDVRGYEIKDVFDALQMTDDIPFAQYESYYKILNGFEPDIDIDLPIPEDYPSITLIVRKPLENVKGKDFFTNFRLYSVPNQDQMILELQEDENVTKDFLFKTVSKVLEQLKPTITEESVQHLNGTYTYPNQTLNKVAFAHLVMDDPMFYNNVYLDEKRNASTKMGYMTLFFRSI